ncbi:CotH kinase family protein [Arachnia propionica]|uniref:CotH kinase family protein n=1 Tax=Arachnia propionica TaxID=1750 RepID=UPI001BABA0B7|nr:CotH kinase family protein [Arachnia propionica]QUC14296.1 CotH kinase family protein [Arachnia propionica]
MKRISRRGVFAAVGLGAFGAVILSGCGSFGETSAGVSSGKAGKVTDGYLDPDSLHSVEITVDQSAYQEMITAYTSNQTKNWIEATVTVDGVAHEKAGLKLKGNSSLQGISADSEPQKLPWLVRFDKFVDGANHDGMTRMVIRASSSTSALNEAVALDLLAKTGLASEKAAHISLSVNGSDPVLRLTCQDLDESWVAQNFDVAGLLYKAESTGDYTYRGTDESAYKDVFDQETGKANLTPLIEFLQFINESSDADFQSGLAQRVDVDKMVTYLAFEDVIDNFDDITGPGNNSFLWWAEQANQMTVVAWDHNCAFGLKPGAGQQGQGGGQPPGGGGQGQPPGGGQQPGGGQPPGDGGAPSNGQAPTGQPPGGAGGQQPGGGGSQTKANALVDRFNSLMDGETKVSAERDRLKQELYTSGVAQTILDARAKVLTDQAGSLIEQSAVEADKQTIAAYFTK